MYCMVPVLWWSFQAPHLNWRDVVAELDHQGFTITGKPGLKLVGQALTKALTDAFPIDLIYKPWKNTEGQVSHLVSSLSCSLCIVYTMHVH